MLILMGLILFGNPMKDTASDESIDFAGQAA